MQVGGFCSTDPHVGEDLDVSYRLGLHKHSMLFVPDMVVEHHLPSRWTLWVVKMFRYGSARGKCLWIYQSFFAAKLLLPLLFSAFILFSLLLVHPLAGFAVVSYLAVCFFVSFFFAPPSEGMRVFLLMLATHFFYSLGVWAGFFQAFFVTVASMPKVDRQVHKVPKAGNFL